MYKETVSIGKEVIRMIDFKAQRNLDGVFFRVKRNDKFENICFSDLTDEEMDDILKDRDAVWLKKMCKILGNTIRLIGDDLNIVSR